MLEVRFLFRFLALVWNLRFGICDLFGICLPAGFLAGYLEFVILDTKLQGRAIYLCPGSPRRRLSEPEAQDQVFNVK